MLRFSIVGDANAERNAPDNRLRYEIPVPIADTQAIARALGAEIARQGHGLLVCDARFIEAEVVAGFVAAKPQVGAAGRPILIRQPQDEPPVQFAGETTDPELFERRADRSGLWESSFYRALSDSAGVILLGGAKTTLVAGHVALGARIPLLALKASGGAADQVWRSMSPDIDLPSTDEHALMAQPLSPQAVTAWIDALVAQHRRRHAVESGPIVWHAVHASLLFALALAAALASNLVPEACLALPWRHALFFASTPLAGAAGAAVRMVFERRYGSGPLVPPSIAITFALGMMAGALAGLLYIVAQPGDLDLLKASGLRLVAIVTVVSTVGGLTAEGIFRKLLGIDVLQTRGLAAGGDKTGSKS